MIGKKLLTATCAALFAGGVWSAWGLPAYPRPVVFTQSDGTQITIRVVGDEFCHYVLSEEGYTLTGGPDGDYYYATLGADGTLEPTRVKARPTAMLTRSELAEIAGLQRGLKPEPNRALKEALRMSGKRTRSSRPVTKPGMPSAPELMSSASAPTTGQLRSLIILVETSDVSFSIANPQQTFSNMLNQEGYNQNGATGSAWDYYNQNSNGQFDPEFVVVGPYKVSREASYYASTNGNARVPELVVEACRMADNDGLDFSQFAGEDGVIRDIFIFFAGYNQAEGVPNTIWPHRWTVEGMPQYTNVRLDGMKLEWYACTSELQGVTGRTMSGIGPFCHEFGHVLGWPDFYDADYDGSGGTATALENYSLMCAGNYNNNGHTPPALTLLERWMVGWAEPRLVSEAGDYTLRPVWEDDGLLVQTGTDNDYFLFEARAMGGFVWDNYIGDYYDVVDGSKGLFVMHIDFTASYQDDWTDDNTLNANPNHECAKLVRAVPGSGSAYMPSLTFFPGAQNVTSLMSSNNADYIGWSGNQPQFSFSSITVDEAAGVVRMTARARRENEADHGLVAQSNQYDALVSWDGEGVDRWSLSWSGFSDGLQGSAEVEGDSFFLENLQPGATYELTLSPLSGEQQGLEQYYEFTTSSLDASCVARINLLSSYAADTPIALSLLDYSGTLSRVDWYVDGELTEEHYAPLPSGEHRITAKITDEDGTTEYLVKYVTIN